MSSGSLKWRAGFEKLVVAYRARLKGQLMASRQTEFGPKK
jgi:hypothetical protein